ncbi:MAG TPA: hypothetical protein VFM18_22020 [Methanosarcina sp.]|nr:hypothetical protein [Methanosarcina sp.]
MVKPVTKAEISSLIKGIITEASPLNFPADASRDEENYELNINGSRDRRLGIDFEDNYAINSTGYDSTSIKDVGTSFYKWLSAGNVATNEFIVVQFGSRIDVYDSTKASISRDGLKGSVTLSGVDPTTRFSYGSVDGTLVIAAGTEDIHVVKWTGSALTYSTKRLLVRDLFGLPGLDGNDLNIRPSVQTDTHLYNLRNQGWGIPRKNSSGTLSDPISLFNTAYSKFPSNAENVYTGLQFQPVSGGSPFERIYTDLYDDSLGLDAHSARGYFIIDALRRGTSRLTEYADNRTKFPSLNYPITTLPQDYTPGGATIVCDFAGRIFYGGFSGVVVDGDINSPILSSYILFSQVIKNEDDTIKCYQKGDPTSRDNSDLLDTDGGFIRISGARNIKGLIGLSGSLFVLADNGVWKVEGGSNYGFTATNYAVTKISSFGCNNHATIVTINDSIYFWGEEGIFIVNKNQFGDWIVNSLSLNTIQSYYDGLESTDKIKATGFYDPFDKKIRWIVNSDLDVSNNNVVIEIVFDVQLGAFTKNRFYNLTSDTPEIIGSVSSSAFLSGESPQVITSNSVNVVSNGENVQMTINTRTSGIQSMKYVTLYSTVAGKVGYTFSQYKDITFRDWKSADGIGVDAKGYILLGQVTAGDSSIFKQTPYIVMHFLRTENGVVEVNGELIPANQSSCLVRSQWDWANSINSGKWSDLFQAYRYRRPYLITGPTDSFDNGYEVVTSKNKLRGRGRALSLYLETEPYKDCRLLGWSLSLTGNNLS